MIISSKMCKFGEKETAMVSFATKHVKKKTMKARQPLNLSHSISSQAFSKDRTSSFVYIFSSQTSITCFGIPATFKLQWTSSTIDCHYAHIFGKEVGPLQKNYLLKRIASTSLSLSSSSSKSQSSSSSWSPPQEEDIFPQTESEQGLPRTRLWGPCRQSQWSDA